MELTGLIFAALSSAKKANERIDNLPFPMVFKGSLGTGGTISTLPTASSENEGFVYIVITDGTYAGQTAKAGDTFVSDGSAWVLVPSADEPSVIDDSVTSTALTWSSDKINTEFNGVKVKTLNYIGDGATTKTFDFGDYTPKIIFTIQAVVNSGYSSSADSILFGESLMYRRSSYSDQSGTSIAIYVYPVTFSGNTMILNGNSAAVSMNSQGVNYTMVYV